MTVDKNFVYKLEIDIDTLTQHHQKYGVYALNCA
jgi:hypothetical protein